MPAIPVAPVLVRVLIDDKWHGGTLEAWRRDGDHWRSERLDPGASMVAEQVRRRRRARAGRGASG